MVQKFLITAFVASLFTGCASVPMGSTAESTKAKRYDAPSSGNAGLYIYRSSFVGQALKKDIWIDGKCVGESANKVFFFEEVKGDQEHKISTESEFSPNDLLLKTESGKNYFIEQYIKMGVFVGGAGINVVGDEEGKKAVSELNLAVKGTCSK